MRTQPKKNLTIVNRYKGKRGNAVRIGYQNRILEKAPIFPKPLEYDDIDKAIFDFVDTLIPIVVDGKLIPTYTLYSNQRFSEYTQMWEHSDENGNLYLNFKTVNREKILHLVLIKVVYGIYLDKENILCYKDKFLMIIILKVMRFTQ